MSNIKNIHKRILSNSSWLVGDKTLSSIFAALQTVIVARILGVEQYGLLVLVIAYIDLLNRLVDFRMWETATKYIGTFWETGDLERTQSMIKLSYLVDVLSGILAFVIAILTATLISKYVIKTPEAYKYVWIYSFTLLMGTSSSTSISILRIFNKFRLIAIIRSSQNFFRLLFVTVLLVFGFGINGVLYGLVIASILGFIMRISMVIKILNEYELGGWWKSKIGLVRDHIKGITWFVFNTNIAGTIKMGEEKSLGILILGYLVGKDAVAYYKIATSAAKILNYIIGPLYESIYPEFIKIKSQNILNTIKPLIKKMTITFLKIGIPLAILIIFFSDMIIEVVYGKSYLPSANALKIIAVAAVIDGLTFWNAPVLLAMGKPGLRTIINLIAVIFYLILLVVLVPLYSFMGAAYAFLGFVVLKTSLSLFILQSSYFGLLLNK